MGPLQQQGTMSSLELSLCQDPRKPIYRHSPCVGHARQTPCVDTLVGTLVKCLFRHTGDSLVNCPTWGTLTVLLQPGNSVIPRWIAGPGEPQESWDGPKQGSNLPLGSSNEHLQAKWTQTLVLQSDTFSSVPCYNA